MKSIKFENGLPVKTTANDDASSFEITSPNGVVAIFYDPDTTDNLLCLGSIRGFVVTESQPEKSDLTSEQLREENDRLKHNLMVTTQRLEEAELKLKHS